MFSALHLKAYLIIFDNSCKWSAFSSNFLFTSNEIDRNKRILTRHFNIFSNNFVFLQQSKQLKSNRTHKRWKKKLRSHVCVEYSDENTSWPNSMPFIVFFLSFSSHRIKWSKKERYFSLVSSRFLPTGWQL